MLWWTRPAHGHGHRRCLHVASVRIIAVTRSLSTPTLKLRHTTWRRREQRATARPQTDHEMVVTHGHWRSPTVTVNRLLTWGTPESRGSSERVACVHTAEATGSKPVSPTKRFLPGGVQPHQQPSRPQDAGRGGNALRCRRRLPARQVTTERRARESRCAPGS
jgi:hypothetical protein